MMRANRCAAKTLIATLTMVAGCRSGDERLVEAVQRGADRQAEQSQAIARQSQEHVAASRALVEADSQARRELIAAQQEANRQLQTERTSLDRRQEQLDLEGREIAAARHRDPAIAASIANLGVLLACLLPLAVCLVLLWPRNDRSAAEEDLSELLVAELIDERPQFLAGRSPLSLGRTQSRLPDPNDGAAKID